MDPDLTRWPPAVAALCQPGCAPIDAIFDMDGTLLQVDLGDELVAHLLAAGHRPPAFMARAPTLAAYQQATRGWNDLDQFILCGLITQGLTDAELDLSVRSCLAQRVPLRVPVVALARAMVAAGHRVWILTGSAQAIGKALARSLGLDDQRVVGLRLAADPQTGRYTDQVLPPVTFGSGKVDAARQRICLTPGFAIGDAHTDLPLLRAATVAVAVPSLDGRLGPLARAAGVPVRQLEDLGG